MAELTETKTPTDEAASCCSTEAQETCCEPADKASCCGEAAAGGSCGCSAGASTDDAEDIREAVRARYAAAATAVSERGSCCGANAALSDEEAAVFGAGLYGNERDELPDTATMASLGCGNPTAVAELREGETVLDLGSGGGLDVLLSARRVGPAGKAYGLDMTDEMLALARENQRKAGVENVEWLRGQIEDDPSARGDRRRRDLKLRDQPLRRQAQGAGGGGPRAETRRTPRRLRRHRRPGHGRGDPRGHAAVDRLHRRRAHPRRVRTGARRAPASSTSRSARPTACTSTPAPRSSAPRKPGAAA